MPVGMIAHMHLEIKETVDNDIDHDGTLHIPYSVVMVGIAGFLAVVVALMLIWLTGTGHVVTPTSGIYKTTPSTVVCAVLVPKKLL